MLSRSILVFFVLLSSISLSQNGFEVGPSFGFLLNGVESGGTIKKSDSILTIIPSDGQSYSIVSLEMKCTRMSLRVPGNVFSNEMRQFLRSSEKGARISFLLSLRNPVGSLIVVGATFSLE